MTTTSPPLEPALNRPGRLGPIYRTARLQVQGENFRLTLARLTLIMLMLYTGEDLGLLSTMQMLGILGLVHPPLLRSRLYWATITATLFAFYAWYWHIIDNHKYLMSYWCLTMLLATCAHDPQWLMRHSARLLIGLCFAFATVWKLISPEFVDGSFFHLVLIADIRFVAIDAVSGPDLVTNNRQIEQLAHPLSTLDSVELQATAAAAHLAHFFTLWTLLLEALIALTFLWPRPGRLRTARHALLILFAVTTYPIATVSGFALLLMILGLAQTEPHHPRLRLAYLLLVAAVPLCRLIG